MMSIHIRNNRKLKHKILTQNTAPARPQHSGRLHYLTDLLQILILTLLCSTSWAIDSDRSAPIEIQADSAKISEAKQTAIYKGNVELVQGTLKITCDQLTVFNSSGGVERVEAKGAPAAYSQRMSLDKPPLDAAASTIVYLPAQAQIRLEGNASIKQGGNIFEGQLIEYDLEKQVLMASGSDANQNSPKEKQRVKMTLQPQSTP